MLFSFPLSAPSSTTGISYVQKSTVQDTAMQDTTVHKTTMQSTPKHLRTKKTRNKKTKIVTKPNPMKAEEFSLITKNGKYFYCQQMLCNTNCFKHVEGENFSKKIKMPFGKSTVSFRYCKKSNRYIRYVCGGGSYKKIANYLTNSVVSTYAKEIYTIILNYMTFMPNINCSLEENLNAACQQIYENHSKFFNYINTINEKDKILQVLSNLCAILTLCDPCYGPGETGGAEVRSFLRKTTSGSDCDFRILMDPEKFPPCLKKAYQLFRNYFNGTLGKAETGNIESMTQETSGIHETFPQSDEGTYVVEGTTAFSRQPSQQVIPSSQNFITTENSSQTQYVGDLEDVSVILASQKN